MSQQQPQLSLNLITAVLDMYYKERKSMTKISKTNKISPTVIKNIIAKYSSAYLKKYPQFKREEININDYEAFIMSREEKDDAKLLNAQDDHERKREQARLYAQRQGNKSPYM